MVKPGRYQHYKGNDYEVVGVARHSEDETDLVVYRQLYGEQKMWVRPITMFTESVSVNGRSVERFRYIGQ